MTCHRFGRLADSSAKQRPDSESVLDDAADVSLTFDGDKSPAKSADKSTHSKNVAASPRCVLLRQFVLLRPIHVNLLVLRLLQQLRGVY